MVQQQILLEKQLIPSVIHALKIYCGVLRNGADEDILKNVDKLEKLILKLEEYVN